MRYRDTKNREGGRAFLGLIFVAIGAALLLRNMNFPIPYWLFTWPMILIAIGIYSGIRHSFRNISWVIITGIGVFFLFDEFIPGMRLEPFFWPIFFICIGAVFILRPPRYHRFNRWNPKTGVAGDDHNYSSYSKSGFIRQDDPDITVEDSNDYLHISSIFSGVKRNILSKNFQGGDITCVFGGAEVNFTQADINGKAIIRVEQLFGGAKLIIPPHWLVQNEIDGIFHGVEDKRSYNQSDLNPGKTLILRGTSMFAGIEIKSY